MRRRKMVLDELRTINLGRADLEEAVAALAFGKLVVAEHKSNELEPPEWLKDKVIEIESYVKTKRRESITLALREARLKADRLKSRETKAGEVDAEIKRLESLLGQ